MKSAIPLWAVLSEIAGLLLATLGVSAHIKLGFVPEQLQSRGYAFSLIAVGLLIGLPKLYFSLKSIKQKSQEPRL